MARQPLALVDVLAEIEDFRQASGRRYSLASVLALAVAAMLCGYKSYSAMAEWGRHYGGALAQALGFRNGRTPCAATFCNILGGLDKHAFERRLAQWAESLLAAHALDADWAVAQATALDGKTLRGARQQGAPAAHLLSAVGQRLGVTLYQCAVADHTNEIGAVGALLSGLLLPGKVLTMDALLTQEKVARQIVARGADYVMVVKGNQPQLRATIEGGLGGIPFYWEAAAQATTLDSGHGRIEERQLLATSVLCGQEDIWPGIAQVFQVERRVIRKRSGKASREVVYGVTSLRRKRASAEQLLRLVRQHWQIENGSHWVRDVTYEEDRSQVRKGSLPQVLAALRNTAIGLMRWAGERNIAAACRRFAAQPWAALALIGIKPEN